MAFLDWLKNYLPEDNTGMPNEDTMSDPYLKSYQVPAIPTPLLNQNPAPVASPVLPHGGLDYGNTFLRTPVDETKAKAAETIRTLLFPKEQKELISPAPLTPMKEPSSVPPEQEKLETLLKSTSPKTREPAAEIKKEIPSDGIDKKAEAEMEDASQNTELSDAQNSRSEQLRMANMLEGLATAGTAFATRGQSSYKELTPDAFKGLREQANLGVQEVKEKREATQADMKQKLDHAALIKAEAEQHSESELSDPNSDISKLYQNTIKKDYPGLKTDGISAKNLDGAFAKLLQRAGLKESIEARKQQAKIMAEAKKEQNNDKKDIQLEKSRVKMGEDLDPTRFRAGTLKDNQKRIDAAGRINTLFDQFPDYNIPKTQTRELSTSVAGLLSNGSAGAGVTQINELMAHTGIGGAMGLAEYITNNPTGLQQQKFMRMLHDTAKREKATAERQVVEQQFKKAYSTHGDLKKKSPNDFYDTLSMRTGLSVDEIKDIESKPGFKGNLPELKKEQSETVNVKLPDGRTGTIPKSKLEEAKKQGAVEI